MTDLIRIIIAVILMAAVTYIPRAFPIIFLRKKLGSKFLRSFLYYVPYAVLGAMIFPKVVYSTGNIYSAMAGMGVAFILAYLEQGLMKVAIGAILTVYIIGLFFLIISHAVQLIVLPWMTLEAPSSKPGKAI